MEAGEAGEGRGGGGGGGGKEEEGGGGILDLLFLIIQTQDH